MAKNKKSIRPRLALWVLAFVLAIAAFAAWAGSLAFAKHDGEEVRLLIPHGATQEAVRDSLEAHLGDFGSKTARLLELRGHVHPGAYVVPSGITAYQAWAMLSHGRQTPVRVTFSNARLMDDMALAVSRNLEVNAADLLAACDTLLPAAGYEKTEFPAAFMPDTYEMYWTDDAATVARRMMAVRDAFWTEERTRRAACLGLTPKEVATLASIVEEETNKADERPIVARLYLNRLKRGMPLQADPTVKFAVGDFSLRRILNEHLAVESPYNTYKHKGLPPGPIRIASAAGMQAVLDAPQNDYLYMCAKEDFSGYHNFTADYNQHLANARRYQAALNRRGITR